MALMPFVLVVLLVFASLELRAEPSKVLELVTSLRNRFEGTELFKKFGNRPAVYSDEAFIADPSKARIMTLIEGDALIQLLEDGEFKNQHQTGSSGGGTYAPSVRFKLEEEMAGQSLKKLFPKKKDLLEALPKYGMAEFPDFAKHPKIRDLWLSEIRSADDLDTYGEIALYFKDSIKERTTMMPQDSGGFVHLSPTGKSGSVLEGVHERLQTFSQKKLILSSLQMDEGNFFEAEIWGKVTLADIDYIVLPEAFFYDEPSISMEQLKKALKLTGIPVYREKLNRTDAERTTEQLRTRVRGPLIFAEDPVKRRNFLKTKTCRSQYRKLLEPVDLGEEP